MPRATTAAVGSEAAMTEAATAVLLKGGSSIDACIAGFFAAAGRHPGVLLGSTVMLVAGTGSGAHVFDGSLVQPGRGAPRPRGFVADDEVPQAARIPVASIGALLAAAHAHAGKVPMSELATPGVKIARAQRALGRANLLRRVGAAGPVALREASFARSLMEIAGRPEGGNLTNDDLQEVQARVAQPIVEEGVVSVEPSSRAIDTPSMETRAMVACDHRGVLAAMHCAFDAEGVEVAPHEVTASRLAVPVRRGVPRVTPGTHLSMPAPIALLTERGVPWAAVALDGTESIVWEQLGKHIAPDITMDQALRSMLADNATPRRAWAVVREARAGAEPRAFDVK